MVFFETVEHNKYVRLDSLLFIVLIQTYLKRRLRILNDSDMGCLLLHAGFRDYMALLVLHVPHTMNETKVRTQSFIAIGIDFLDCSTGIPTNYVTVYFA